MLETRRQELLDKIAKVASNDITQFDGLDYDIKLNRDEENDSIVIDLLANWMRTDQENPDRMAVSYAASKSAITRPHREHIEKMNKHLETIVKNTIKSL